MDSERRIQSTAVSTRRFKFLLNTQARREDSPETARPESRATQIQQKIGIASSETAQQYKKQKGLFKPVSLNLKEKISMNHFLFDSESSAMSPLFKHTPKEQSYQATLKDIKSEDRINTSQPINTRNLEVFTATSTPKENYGSTGFFKTSISTRDSKNAIQVLNEIKQSGPFRVSRPVTSNVSSPKEPSAHISEEIIMSKLDSAKASGVFKTKKGIMVTHKQSLNKQQTISKEILQRKMEIHEAIEKNKGKLMVCALVESKEHTNLKYCFLPRNTSKSFTPRTTRGVREDVEFKIILNELQRKLHLDNSFKFVHLLDGLPVFAFYQVPNYEKVVIISQSSKLGDVRRISNHELVRKFCCDEKKNESIYDVIAGFGTKERIVQCRKEVLSIVDGTHQLTADQLRNLVSLSNEGPLSESTKVIQKAFINGKVGSVLLEGEKTSTYVDRSFLKPWHPKKSSYLEALVAPKNNQLSRKTSLEIGVYETEVEKYIKSSRPLQEHKKLVVYNNIIKEYEDSLKKVNRKSVEDDDEQGIDQEYVDRAQEEARRISAKALQIDQNLGHLLQTNDHALKRALSLSESTQYRIPLSNESTMRTPKKPQEAELIDLAKKRLYDKHDGLDSTIAERKMFKKFTEENIKALDTKKNCIKKLQTVNRELFLKNIPKLINDKKLSRPELHSIYVLYKALCEVTSQRVDEYSVKEGIDFETFRSGIYNVAMQSEEFAARLFFAIDTNFSGFLDWDEFLQAMVTLRAKTLHDKIDLFIKLADEDGNGNLSKDEIFNLTKICLGKFIKDETTDGFLDDLCHYFTKLIFTSLDFDINDEIPLEAIKQAIVSGHPNSDLLAMFCGADL